MTNYSGALFRCAPLTRLKLDSTHELVRSHWINAAMVLPVSLCEAAQSCGQFGSLQAHAERLRETVNCPPDIEQKLTRLAEAGFMLPSDTLIVADPPATDAAWLAIPTCYRSDLLRITIDSYAANLAGSNSRLAILIADDSPKSTAPPLSKTRFPIVHITHASRRRFADTLAAQSDIPPDVAHFALLGSGGNAPTYGANRNAILIQTLGSKILSVDDDTICQPANAPGTTSAITVHPHRESQSLWSFPDRRSATTFPTPSSVNVAAEHSRLLGTPLILHLNTPALLDETCQHMWLSLCTGTARILVTTNGLVGDAGMADPTLAFRMAPDPATRRRLAAPGAYAAALQSRELLRQSLSTTITHTGPLMATCLGLDNRDLLPPFFPVYRNEDGIFGRVLQHCFPHGYAAHLPFVVPHVPEPRPALPAPDPASIRISDLVLACIGTCPNAPQALPDAARMRALGRHLIELGNLSAPDFCEALRMPLANRSAGAIGAAESLLSTYCPPANDPWGDDLRTAIRLHHRALLNPALPVPTDLQPPDRAQDLIRRYGELLFWWPAIVAKTRLLKEKGDTLLLS